MEDTRSSALFCWTILYPNKEGGLFDFEDYSKKLLPQYIEILGDNCVRYEVRRGLASPGAPAPHYLCNVNIWLKSRERFREAMADPRMKAVLEKISAITDIQSIRQMDEVVT